MADLLDLARQAVASPHWRWMPGMRTVEVPQPPPWALPLWDEAVVYAGGDDDDEPGVCTVFGATRALHSGALPDLADPATLGCLLALVREAWGGDLHVECLGAGEWECVGGLHAYRASSEPAALVAALLAAPPPKERT
jgi:hypothetical protein